MELKLEYICPRSWQKSRFNRTIMELKLRGEGGEAGEGAGFNRTIMELKQDDTNKR